MRETRVRSTTPREGARHPSGAVCSHAAHAARRQVVAAERPASRIKEKPLRWIARARRQPARLREGQACAAGLQRRSSRALRDSSVCGKTADGQALHWREILRASVTFSRGHGRQNAARARAA